MAAEAPPFPEMPLLPTTARTAMGRRPRLRRRRRILLLLLATALLGVSAFVATSRGLAVVFVEEAPYLGKAAAGAASPGTAATTMPPLPSPKGAPSSASSPPPSAGTESSLLVPAAAALQSLLGRSRSAATNHPEWESASIETRSSKNGSQELHAPPSSKPAAVSAPASPAQTNSYFYSVARTDRAGASILDMVTALAYGYAKNLTFRGACYIKNMTVDAPKRQADKLSLIRAIGMQDTMVYACPPQSRIGLIVPRTRYQDKRYSLMTPEFINWLRAKSSAGLERVAVTPSAVVHVRRGDIDPCKQWKVRYLPSSYYLDVLDRYVPAEVPVTVYSESASIEPFGDFGNATVKLDTDVAEVWGAVMAASHVVLSRSSFAYVPALLNANNATVVYPSNWSIVVPPLLGWKEADPDIQERSERRVDQLAKERCRNYTSVKTGRSYFNASRRRR